MPRQPSNPNDKKFITKHSRHQYSGSTVIEIYPSDFAVLKERYATALHPDSIVTGGYLIIEEVFSTATMSIGDDTNSACYLAATALNTLGVKPLLVTGKVTDTLNKIKLTTSAVLTGTTGKARLIINHVGMDKSNWTVGNVDD